MKYKVGDIVKGRVTGIENYGIFVALLYDEYSGLIHISEMSEKFVKNVFDYVQMGEVILAKVIDVNKKTKQLKLSIKGLDYRIDDKKRLEDRNGFTPLREMLPQWIDNYVECLNDDLK